MQTWTYDREMKWHTLPTTDGAFVFVYKTEGGDYAISAMREGDAGGGEVEYRGTLMNAKKFGAAIAADGTFANYLMSEHE